MPYSRASEDDDHASQKDQNIVGTVPTHDGASFRGARVVNRQAPDTTKTTAKRPTTSNGGDHGATGRRQQPCNMQP
jgi:hypothetical protein